MLLKYFFMIIAEESLAFAVKKLNYNPLSQ
jgi:hypothetical protein